MLKFLITATILVILGFFYLGTRLIPSTLPETVFWILWLSLGLGILNLLWLPFRRWQKPHINNFVTRFFEASAYRLMGLLSLLLFFAVVSEFFRFFPDSLTRIAASIGFENSAGLLAAFIAGNASLFFAWGRVNVALGARYKFVSISQNGKKNVSKSSIRLVQISDLHIGRVIRKGYVEHVVSMIEKAKPDLICLTGDIGDGNCDARRDDSAPLKRLAAVAPVFYVSGNHEYYWGFQKWLELFRSLDITCLINESRWIDIKGRKVQIAGITDPAALRFDEPGPVMPKAENADFSILLSHQPNFARTAQKHGFHLQLSGHTHGGQYVPWTLMVHLFYRFAKGLYRFKGMWVYVNEGTGFWGAPLRIGTRLEISVIDIG